MNAFSVRDVKPIERLRAIYGDEITLQGHRDEETVYRLMAEFSLGSREYAVLQSEPQMKEDTVDIYRIVNGSDGEPQLESIDDDDEWDDVFDLYDEMTFDFDKDGE